jgi:hypothetical protein
VKALASISAMKYATRAYEPANVNKEIKMRLEAGDTYTIRICLAGDIAQAKQIIRAYCMEYGFCVTISPTTYIYRGGEEKGFEIGIANYPRFPKTKEELWEHAFRLSDKLMLNLCQESYMCIGSDQTIWKTRRESSNADKNTQT